ncbi:MAG: nitroreductase family protein [Negativicutes bacterium]|nr:nitroreductase family protein [Negativicutes bacterium]
MEALDFIYKRHSVRKFQDTPVSGEHIREIIKAATYAPSGVNAQNWHFVVVCNKDKVAEIARIVERKNETLAPFLKDEAKIKAFRGKVNYHTFFKGAPALVLVYAGPYPTVADDLAAANSLPAAEIAKYARPHPAVQNIAAALENLHLAAASLGYGTCWMTGPTYAADEISAYIGFAAKEGYYLAALTPLGVPASSQGANPPRKPLDEVLTIIE